MSRCRLLPRSLIASECLGHARRPHCRVSAVRGLGPAVVGGIVRLFSDHVVRRMRHRPRGGAAHRDQLPVLRDRHDEPAWGVLGDIMAAAKADLLSLSAWPVRLYRTSATGAAAHLPELAWRTCGREHPGLLADDATSHGRGLPHRQPGELEADPHRNQEADVGPYPRQRNRGLSRQTVGLALGLKAQPSVSA